MKICRMTLSTFNICGSNLHVHVFYMQYILYQPIMYNYYNVQVYTVYIHTMYIIYSLLCYTQVNVSIWDVHVHVYI